MQISLVEIRFRVPSACRDRDVTVKNAFRNRSSIFSLRLQRGISRAIRKFFSSSSCSLRRKDGIFGCALRVYRIDRRGNLRNSIETDANAIRAWLMLHRIVSKQGSSRDRSDRYPAPTFDRKVARIFQTVISSTQQQRIYSVILFYTIFESNESRNLQHSLQPVI